MAIAEASEPASATEAEEFSIGICATGRAEGAPQLLVGILREHRDDRRLRAVILVASRCRPGTMDRLRAISSSDPRVVLVEEEERRGKWEAVNTIIRRSEGKFLVLVNADASPAPGAIGELLMAIRDDREAGLVSGSPVVERKSGLMPRVLELLWLAHNVCSLSLNHMGVSNHCTDELVVARSDALEELPPGIVNDGAYIAGRARARGFGVRFDPRALVLIDVPSRPIDLVRQRRRILFGHLQVWRVVGRAPMTLEALMLASPRRGVGMVAGILAANPRLLAALPFALAEEAISFLGALVDTLTSSREHAVWKRYGE